MGKKIKKNKRWRLKLEEDDTLRLSPHKPIPYRTKGNRDSIILEKTDLRYLIMKRIYDSELNRSKVRLFFQTFTFDRGSLEADLCEGCWEYL